MKIRVSETSRILASATPIFKEKMSPAEYNQRLEQIRHMITPYRRRKPARVTNVKSRGTVYADALISDVLKAVRHGESDFVTSESQVVELLRYEPEMEIKYCGDGYWVCTLEMEEEPEPCWCCA